MTFINMTVSLTLLAKK